MIDFNPRTPCGVRHVRRSDSVLPPTFQSTHPLRGATNGSVYLKMVVNISIHAPLAGCDTRQRYAADGRGQISIHAPLAGCD